MEAGTDVTMECSTNQSASSITWQHDSVIVTSSCTSYNPRYVTKSTVNNCYLTALGNYSVQGPYGCSDGSGRNVRAVAVVIGNFKSLSIKLRFASLACYGEDGGDVLPLYLFFSIICPMHQQQHWTDYEINFSVCQSVSQ